MPEDQETKDRLDAMADMAFKSEWLTLTRKINAVLDGHDPGAAMAALGTAANFLRRTHFADRPVLALGTLIEAATVEPRDAAAHP